MGREPDGESEYRVTSAFRPSSRIPARPGCQSLAPPRTCFLLIFAALFSGISFCQEQIAKPPPLTTKPVYNVALNKPFEETAPGDPRWKGLTDGVVDSDIAPGCYATDNRPGFPKSICIDLGGVYPLRQIRILNSLNGNTKAIAVYYGPSRHRMDKGWKYVFPSGIARDFCYTVQDKPARFIKVVFEDSYGGGFGGDNILYVREIQVFSSSKEPLDATHPIDRSKWNRSSRQLKIVRRLTIERHLPPKIVLLGDESIEATGQTVPFRILLQEKLARDLPSGSSPATDSPLVIGEGRQRNLAETNASIRRNKELVEADIVLVYFSEKDRSGNLESQLRSLVRSIDRRTNAAIVGIVPPLRPQSDKEDRAAQEIADDKVRRMKQTFLAEGCAVIDLYSIATAMGDTVEVFDDQGRLTPEGHQFVAEEIYRALVPSKGER